MAADGQLHAEVLFRVKLQRQDSSSWGFRLRGGLEYGEPLTLLKVNADSVAARCGLRAGDIVVRLCGFSADTMTHLMAQQTIASCGDSLEIIVERADVTSQQRSLVAQMSNNVDELRHLNAKLNGQVSESVVQSRQRRRHSDDLNGTDGLQHLHLHTTPEQRHYAADEPTTGGHQSKYSDNNSVELVNSIDDIPSSNDKSYAAARPVMTSTQGQLLAAPVEALLTTDAVSSVQEDARRQLQDTVDVDDAASELSDEESASVIEVEVGRTDRWSPMKTDSNSTPATSPTAAVSTSHFGPPTSLSLPRRHFSPTIDDGRRAEYSQTAPWRCLPVRHRASIASYSDPDIASSVAAASDVERRRLETARQRRHLARSTDKSHGTPTNDKLQRQLPQQRQQHGDVVSRSSYVPQKPPPPLPMPESDLVRQLRPVVAGEATTTTTLCTTTTATTTTLHSSFGREPQRPVRELVAQLSGVQLPNIATTTTQQPQLQQPPQRRLQRRQLLHGRRLSSSSSDAETDYEIFINTPPAAAAAASYRDDVHDDSAATGGWTERLLSASCKPPPLPPSGRPGRSVITPTVSYHSTVTYRDLFDPLARRYSLPTSTDVVPTSRSGAALHRKVRFAEPPESSVIEIESRRRRAADQDVYKRADTASDWLATASDNEYSSASSLSEKLDRIELENALASAAMKRSRPFHHHYHHHPPPPPHQPPQHNIASLDPLSRQAQTRVRLEPIEERIIPIQRQRIPQQLQQQPETTTTDIRRHYAVYRRRASNVEPSLSYLSPPSAAVVVDSDNPAAGGGFCVSVGRHSRGFSVSLRPKQQLQQQQLVSVVADDSSPRQRSPSNVRPDDQQPSRFTIYQPLLTTGRTSSTAQQLYDLPHRHLLLPLSPSHPAAVFDADDVKPPVHPSSSWFNPVQPSRQASHPSQPLPPGWIISPSPHPPHELPQPPPQKQQLPTPHTDSVHVVHNMSGILAFFDKSFTEKVLNWPTQQPSEPKLVQSETYKLVREMDEEQHRMDSL